MCHTLVDLMCVWLLIISNKLIIVKLLGVVFSGNFNFDEHVTFVLSICAQRLYFVKLLRSQGMPECKLHVIFVAYNYQ